MLQWGRDLTVTDRRGGTSINPVFEYLLQWGRDLTVTDRVAIEPDRPLIVKASMGPRPNGHG